MIRQAAIGDAAGIAAVHVASWQGAYRGQLPDAVLDALDVVRYTAGWQRLLAEQEPPAVTLVAEVGGAIVGFADAGPTRDDGSEHENTAELTTSTSPPSDGTAASAGR